MSQTTAEAVYHVVPSASHCAVLDTLQCLMPLSKCKELYLLKNAKCDSLLFAILTTLLLLSQRCIATLAASATTAVAVRTATADDS